jgi:hypothetical protein
MEGIWRLWTVMVFAWAEASREKAAITTGVGLASVPLWER